MLPHDDETDDHTSPAEERLTEKFGDPESDLTAKFADGPASTEFGAGDEDDATPSVRDYAEVDADRATKTAFWAAVVYANVGLFLVAFGPMLAYFRGQSLAGAGLVVVGLLAFARVYTMHRDYLEHRRSREGADEGTEGSDED